MPMARISIATAWIRASLLLSHQVGHPAGMTGSGYWTNKFGHAASRNIRAHGPACSVERDRSAHDRHVSAVTAGHRSRAQRLDGAGAIHHLRLPHRICRRANFLWAGVRSTRPQADPDRRARALLHREPGLLTFDIDRNAQDRKSTR